ncbi:hypothetical protein DFH28DRAFT_1031 [Melampsora americana]|nr:hypothetical protein DFH28DRAFT_1031 [Melampsora americana]
MSTKTSEISEILGHYMLKGWTLTDTNCSKLDCLGCPLMRSKSGDEFCARCDGAPIEIKSNRSSSTSSSKSNPIQLLPSHSPLSTPPTPEEIESDQELEGLNPLANPEVLESRRIQSDLASTRIGQLLLQGWTLLNSSCETQTCWAIPLMRSPKRNQSSAQTGLMKRRWCVICEQDWDPTPTTGRGRALEGRVEPITPSIDSSSSTTLHRSDHHLIQSSTPTDLPPNLPSSIPFQGSRDSLSEMRLEKSPLPSNQASIVNREVISEAKEAIEGALTRMSRNLKSITETVNVHPTVLLKATEDLGKALEIYQKFTS